MDFDEFDYDYETEDELALDAGCYVDDDGHWVPIDEDILMEIRYGSRPDEDDIPDWM